MALEDQIRTLNWQSNYDTIQNTSINGKNWITNYGHQYWSFKIQTPALTREDFQNNFFVLFNDIDGGAKINVKPPIIKDAAGRLGYTDPSTVGPFVLTGSGAGGGGPLVNTIYVDLIDDTTAGMELTYGDFVQFANHNKVYRITGNHSLDPDEWGGAPTQGEIIITPKLIKRVSNQYIKINDIALTVLGIGDTIEYKTDRNGYYIFEKEVREVI